MKGILDTNVIVRHLVDDHPGQSARATRLFEGEHELALSHVILAETIFVLQSVYSVPRADIAFRCWALLAFPSIIAVDPDLLLRALAIYARSRIDFADAYAAAEAEATDQPVVSFDRDFDRIRGVRRIEP